MKLAKMAAKKKTSLTKEVDFTNSAIDQLRTSGKGTKKRTSAYVKGAPDDQESDEVDGIEAEEVER